MAAALAADEEEVCLCQSDDITSCKSFKSNLSPFSQETTQYFKIKLTFPQNRTFTHNHVLITKFNF